MAKYVFFLENNDGDKLKVGEIDLDYYLTVQANIKSMLQSSRLGSITTTQQYWVWHGTIKSNRPGATIIRDYGMRVHCNYVIANNTTDSLFSSRWMSPAQARSLTDSDLTEEELMCLRLSQTAQSALLGVINTGTRGDELWRKYENMGVQSYTYYITKSNAKLFTTASSGALRRSNQTQNGMGVQAAYIPSSNARQWALTHNYTCDLRFSKASSPLESLNLAKSQNKYYSSYFGNSYASSMPIGIEIGVRNGQGANSMGVFSNDNMSQYTYEEVHEDSENTYPGGGNDKNSYPDEGSEEPGGESGKGDFDNTNDPIDFPVMPVWDTTSSGFISVWNPTVVQLTELYAWLYNTASESIVESIKTKLNRIGINIYDAMYTLGIIPVDPVQTSDRELTIAHVSTGFTWKHVGKQFVDFDFGELDVKEYYGALWDYSPYTKISLYVPYIGTCELDTDDVMNSKLTLKARIDVITGNMVAMLKSTRFGRDNLNSVMYHFTGNCLTKCPITVADFSQHQAAMFQLMAGTALAVGSAAGFANAAAHAESEAAQLAAQRGFDNAVRNGMRAGIYNTSNVIGAKVRTIKSGNVSSVAGAMDVQKAYIIIERPISAIPKGFNNYAGYPSFKIRTLGSQEGFTSVSAIKLDKLHATSSEISELDMLLKEGVII